MKICLCCGARFTSKEWCCPGCGWSPEIVNGTISFSPNATETNDSFCAEYFSHLCEVEEGNFWFRSRNQLLIWALQQYFPSIESFLEIGCGTGFVLTGIRQVLPEIELSGSDIFINGLAFAGRRLPSISLFQMDGRKIPFEDHFDVIGAFDVLEHVNEDNTVLSQMFQANKPGGGIILTVPQHRFLWSAVDDYSFHKRRYTRNELAKKVRRAGFKITLVTSFVSFILPLMLFSRLRSRRAKGEFDPLAEFRIGHFLNSIFERILAIERNLIERGFSFPAGGSLLLIAHKVPNYGS